MFFDSNSVNLANALLVCYENLSSAKEILPEKLKERRSAL